MPLQPVSPRADKFVFDPASGRRLKYHAAFESNPGFVGDGQIIPASSTYGSGERRVEGSTNFDLASDADVQSDLLGVEADVAAVVAAGGNINPNPQLSAYMRQAAVENPTHIPEGGHTAYVTDRYEDGSPGMGDEYPPGERYEFDQRPFVEVSPAAQVASRLQPGNGLHYRDGQTATVAAMRGGQTLLVWSDGQRSTVATRDLIGDISDGFVRVSKAPRQPQARTARVPRQQAEQEAPPEPPQRPIMSQRPEPTAPRRPARPSMGGGPHRRADQSFRLQNRQQAPLPGNPQHMKAEAQRLLIAAERATRNGDEASASRLEHRAEQLLSLLERVGQHTQTAGAPPRPAARPVQRRAGFQEPQGDFPMSDDEVTTGFGEFQG